MPQVTIDHLPMYYCDEGRGDVVVLLHGLGSSCDDWHQQQAILSQYYRVITIDLRGHGRSGKPNEPYSIHQFATDVTGLLSHLQIERFHLVGFSMGGMTAFQMAVDHPTHLLSLTVINSAPAVPYQRLAEKILVWQRLLAIRVLGMETLGRIIGRKLFPAPQQKPLLEQFTAQMKKNCKSAYIHSLKSFLGWSVTDQLHKLTMPVLVIGADHDYTTTESKRAYAEKIQRVQVAVVKDSHHATPIDQPQQLNHLLLEFLAQPFQSTRISPANSTSHIQ